MRIARLESRPIRDRPALLAALLAALLLATSATALGDVGEQIIQRCTHGQSLSGFSQRAYSRALKELSADAEEYTDCSSLIRQAQIAAAGGKGGGGTGRAGASLLPTPTTAKEKAVIAHAASAPPEPVRLDGQVVHPGVVHASIASALSSLPTPLLAILAFLLAFLLAVVGATLRNRVRAERSD